MTFPKNSKTTERPKTECALEPNLATWGGYYFKVNLKSSVSFLSIEFEHDDCHSSACLTQNKKSNTCKTGEKVLPLNTYSNLIYVLCSTYSKLISVLCGLKGLFFNLVLQSSRSFFNSDPKKVLSLSLNVKCDQQTHKKMMPPIMASM